MQIGNALSIYRNILYKLRKDTGTAQNDVSSTCISISIRRVSKLEILEKGRISEKKKKKKKKKHKKKSKKKKKKKKKNA